MNKKETANTTTSAEGFASWFVALETYLHDLRVKVLMSIRDGKLDLDELVTLRKKLHVLDMNIAQIHRSLYIAEEELRHRVKMAEGK